jgi:hypothetical protein
MSRGLVAGALAAALLAPAPVRADAAPRPAAPEPPPDPAVVDAGDANLESTSPREGVIFTFALGGALSVGFGMDNATGQGGAVTLRLAHVASSRVVLATELVANALFFKLNVSGTLYQTNVQNFLISGQYYINPALWIRGGVGVGRYSGNEFRMGDAIFRERFRLAGPAGSAGAGVDIVRLKRFRAGIELCSTAMINRDGVLSSNGILFGLSID